MPVRNPDEDDWSKLTKLLTFLNKSKQDVLTLEVNNTKSMNWYIYSSHDEHNDIRNYAGACMTLGSRMIITAFTIQKINTRSSTEADLVGVDNMLSKIIRPRSSSKCRGFKCWKIQFNKTIKVP